MSVADRCVWIVDADSTPILRVQSKIREQNINKRYIFIIHSEYLVRVDERVRAREREREESIRMGIAQQILQKTVVAQRVE